MCIDQLLALSRPWERGKIEGKPARVGCRQQRCRMLRVESSKQQVGPEGMYGHLQDGLRGVTTGMESH